MEGRLQFILFAEISMLLRRYEVHLPRKHSQPFRPFILALTERNSPRLELAGHVRFDYNANGMEKRKAAAGQ